MTWVKICGLVRHEDAQLASDLGADALGFVLAPSPRQADPRALARWLPHFETPALKVGVFLDSSPTAVWEGVDACGFTAVQLHGQESVDVCHAIQQRLPVIKRVRSPIEAELYRPVCQFLLWEPLPDHATGLHDIWAGGLSLDSLPAVLARRPWGIDVARGVEKTPGIKHPDHLRQFLALSKQDLMEA